VRATAARVAAALIALLVVAAAPGSAGWRWVGTDDFTVFYGTGHEAEALDALRALESVRENVRPWTGSLALHVPVAIEDAGLYANGFADPIYYRMHLFTSPPYLRDMAPAERWWELVAVHEYTHISHMTAVRGNTAFLSAVFGRIFSPNTFSPLWVDEGLAVNAESSRSPYEGRLNDGFFDAYMLARAKDGRLPSLIEASVTPLEFPSGTGWYLYGGEFFGYLDRTRGRTAFPRFVQDNGGRLLSFFSPFVPAIGIDRAAVSGFGARFPALWREWQADVRKRAEGFAMDGERVTRRGWFVSDLVADGGRLYYKRSYPVKTAAFSSFHFDEIVERDLATGRERVVVSAPGGFGPGLEVRGGTLWYGRRELARGYENTSDLGFGYETQVHSRELATGRDRVVIQDRIRAFAVLPDGRILLARDRRGAFGTDLLVMDAAGGVPEPWAATDLLVDQFVSDGKRVVATARADGEAFSVFELDVAGRTLRPLVRTPWLEGTPALDGERVLFSANWGKVYSIYAYDSASGALTRLTQGGFAVFPAAAGSTLYFAGLTSEGFDVFRKPVEPAQAALPPDPPFTRTATALDPGTVRRGGYWRNLATLAPALRFPFIDFMQEDGKTTRSFYGVMVAGADAVGNAAEYNATVAWDDLRRRVAVDAFVTSSIAAPLVLTGAGGDMDGRSLAVAAAYPLRAALAPGVTGFQVGAAMDLHDDFTRRRAVPYAYVAAATPRMRADALLLYPFERTSWGSAVTGESPAARIGITQYLGGCQLAVSSLLVANTPGLTTGFGPVRGFSGTVTGRSGAVVSADLSRPVLKLHWGLWNPSFWLEDVVLGAFGDAVLPADRATRWSAGAELHLETWITNMAFPFDWGGRVAWNRDGHCSFDVFVGTTISATALWRLPRSLRNLVRVAAGG